MQFVINGVLSQAEIIHPEMKRTLVVLPGWGQDSRHWVPFLSSLAAPFRFVVLDLPGFGQTQHLPEGAGVEAYTSWVLGCLQKLEVKTYCLFGHSFGGQVASALAATQPPGLEALILLSPSTLRNKTARVRLLEQLYRHLHWLKSLTPGFIFRVIKPLLASDDYERATEAQKKVLSKIILEDLKPLLRKIVVPTTILWGEKDTEIPYAGKILAEEIPDSRLVVLYGLDHSPQLTAPQQFQAILSDVLENL